MQPSATTYSARDYVLSLQALGEEHYVEVTKPHPQNVTNPPRMRWPFETTDRVVDAAR